MKASGANSVFSFDAAPAVGKRKPTSKTPPRARPDWRDARWLNTPACCEIDFTSAESVIVDAPFESHRLRGFLDRIPNADIRAAAANIASHCSIDVSICWLRRDSQERACRHNLAGLPVPPLYNFQINPPLYNTAPL